MFCIRQMKKRQHLLLHREVDEMKDYKGYFSRSSHVCDVSSSLSRLWNRNNLFVICKDGARGKPRAALMIWVGTGNYCTNPWLYIHTVLV